MRLRIMGEEFAGAVPGRRWPTRAVLIAASLAAAAACTDEPVAPRRADGFVRTDVLRGAQGADTTTVKIKRVTDMVVVAANGRTRPTHKVENFNRRAQTIVAHRGTLKATVPAFDPDRPPLPDLSEPAGAPALAASTAEWKRTIPSGTIDGAVIELMGVGDAPASRAVLSRNGQSIFVVTQKWQRTSRAWQLLEREAVAADGSYRELVTVDWGKGSARPSMTALFADATEPSVLFNGQRYRTGEEETCDPCKDKVKAVEDYGAVAFFSVMTSTATCSLAVIAKSLSLAASCFSAIQAAAAAVYNFENAKAARDACWAAPPPCPKPCEQYASIRTLSLREAPSAESGVLVPTRMRRLCEGGGSGDYTGGGFADDTYDPTLYGGDRVCDVWIAYDPDTGEIAEVVILHCYAAQ
ncbi:MAG: hypothetical protein H3C62_11760 [Gemmatimonadaceae bacterium]|nr:hypothetical protein [Gemmatimonadaceae bacterium]